MHNGLKRGLAAGLAAALVVTGLTGCKKNADEKTASVPLVTVGEESVNADAFNFYMRYQQTEASGNEIAQNASWYKMLYGYYGMDIDPWNTDLMGTGQTLGDDLKEECIDDVKKMLLAKAHMEELGIEFTAEDQEKAAKAAADFIAANDEETLNAMDATPENVEQILTLMTIRERAEVPMGADVDTEVSDEEAAQTTISYAILTPKPAEDDEEETELPEEDTGVSVEEGDITEETEEKTNSADETEEEALEELGSEAETETEDPEMAAAKEEAMDIAEALLSQMKDADDFDGPVAVFQDIVDQDDVHVSLYSSAITFGADDDYPSEEIVKACFGQEDGTLIDQVFEVNDSYYVCYVTDGFDEEATAERKEEIVEERRQTLVDDTYASWEEGQEVTVDEAVAASLSFNFSLSAPQQSETEDLIEVITEDESDVYDADATESALE